MLDAIARLLDARGETIKTALAVVGTLSGWLYYGWRKWQDRQPRLTLESKGPSAFIVNHGTEAIELLQSVLSLKNAFERPDLAKTYDFVVAAGGSVRPAERAEVFRLDAAIEGAVAKISEPLRKQMAEYGGTLLAPNLADMDLHLVYCIVGKRKTRVARFERWLNVCPGGPRDLPTPRTTTVPPRLAGFSPACALQFARLENHARLSSGVAGLGISRNTSMSSGLFAPPPRGCSRRSRQNDVFGRLVTGLERPRMRSQNTTC